ncbi:SnoaL-like domain protein [Variovorax sp. SRS16]|uniref:nuclear transport factor 2 family protein n=1 Tax=Variovorax sp. SRS16 TaxID=282217 RepID=UPI001316F6D8|nr:nuclear transport factor 2 family protein [Variovorax sp. SRS16]VTU13451.1 SnoaL-like domain protein [Variovorax sp. SRS16]
MTANPLETWHRIVVTQDPSGLQDLLADDVVFHSPVVHTPQRGKQIVTRYLDAALHAFFSPSFRVIRKLFGDTDAMMEFESEIDGVTLNAVDIVQWNDAGQIIEFRVMVRPLKAIGVVQQKMAERLQAGVQMARDGDGSAAL